MIRLIEANTHALHSEDAILKGKDYIERMLIFYEDSIKMLKGEKTATNFSVKWDGAPAILMFSKTERFGGPGISTKSLFNTNPKYYTSEEEIIEDDRPEGLKTKLLAALKLAQENIIPPGEIWQGDMLFTKGDQKIKSENGIEYVAVQPNTLLYMAPTDSDIGRQISNADIGIVWHTRYDENGQNQSNDATVDKLQNIPEWAFMLDAKVPNLSGKVSINEKESAVFSKALDELYDYCNKITNHHQYDALINNKDFIDFYIMTFQNHKYDVNQEIDPTNFVEELHLWITKKMHKQYNGLDKLKTKKGRDNKRLVIQSTSKELHLIVKSNEKLINDIAHGLKVATEIKNGLLDKLNVIDNWITKYEDSDGLNNTGHEGFVVSNSNGDFVKFVDRSTFSHLNRDSSVIKGWEGNTRTQITESTNKKWAGEDGLKSGTYGGVRGGAYESISKAEEFINQLKQDYVQKSFNAKVVGSNKKYYIELEIINKNEDLIKKTTPDKNELKKSTVTQSSNITNNNSNEIQSTKDDQDILSKHINFLKMAGITPDKENLWRCLGRKNPDNLNETKEFLATDSNNKFKYFILLYKKASTAVDANELQKLDFSEGLKIIKIIEEYADKNKYIKNCTSDGLYSFVKKETKETYKFRYTGEAVSKEGGEKNCGEMFENALALEMSKQTKTKHFEQLVFGGKTINYIGQDLYNRYEKYIPYAVKFMAMKKFLYYNKKNSKLSDYDSETNNFTEKFINNIKQSLNVISDNNVNNISKIIQCGANETKRGIDWSDDDLIGGKNIKNIAEALADIIVVEKGPNNIEIKKYCSAKSGNSHGIVTYGTAGDKSTDINVKSKNVKRFLEKLFSVELANEIYSKMESGIYQYKNDDDINIKIIDNLIIKSEEFKRKVNIQFIEDFLSSGIGNNYYIIHYNKAGGGILQTHYLSNNEVTKLSSKYLSGSIGIKFPNYFSKDCYIYLNSDANGSYRAVENSPFGKIAIVFTSQPINGEYNINSFNAIEVKAAHTKESLLSFEDIYRTCLR